MGFIYHPTGNFWVAFFVYYNQEKYNYLKDNIRLEIIKVH